MKYDLNDDVSLTKSIDMKYEREEEDDEVQLRSMNQSKF